MSMQLVLDPFHAEALVQCFQLLVRSLVPGQMYLDGGVQSRYYRSSRAPVPRCVPGLVDPYGDRGLYEQVY